MKRPKRILKESKEISVATLFKESDKGCAIIAGALLEEYLIKMHEAHIALVSSVKGKSLEPLFDAFGPLSTFAGKILIAGAYGLISAQEFEDLNILRKIRNEAAHCIHEFGFEDAGVKALVMQLQSFNAAKPHELSGSEPNEKDSDDITMMEQFLQLPELKQIFLLNTEFLQLKLAKKVISLDEELLKREKAKFDEAVLLDAKMDAERAKGRDFLPGPPLT